MKDIRIILRRAKIETIIFEDEKLIRGGVIGSSICIREFRRYQENKLNEPKNNDYGKRILDNYFSIKQND